MIYLILLFKMTKDASMLSPLSASSGIGYQGGANPTGFSHTAYVYLDEKEECVIASDVFDDDGMNLSHTPA